MYRSRKVEEGKVHHETFIFYTNLGERKKMAEIVPNYVHTE